MDALSSTADVLVRMARLKLHPLTRWRIHLDFFFHSRRTCHCRTLHSRRSCLLLSFLFSLRHDSPEVSARLRFGRWAFSFATGDQNIRFCRVLLSRSLHGRFLSTVYHVYRASEARPLQLSRYNHTPRQFRNRLLASLLTQTPNRRQVDDIPRPTAPNRPACFAAYNQASPSRRTNQLRSVADQIPPRMAVRRQDARTVAHLELDTALDGLREHLHLEMKVEARREVKGYDVAVE